MKQERDSLEERRKYTERLVNNILPKHVVQYFLHKMQQPETNNVLPARVRDSLAVSSSRCSRPFLFDDDLYYEDCPQACVLFAKICNIPNLDCDGERACRQQTMENVKLLNDVIVEFDELLNENRFRGVEKIKTSGTCYMVVSGLQSTNRAANGPSRLVKHVLESVRFAFAMRDRISAMNQLTGLNLQLQIGINCGAIVAGVIGSRKPHYDVWGNIVNVASRMESTSIPGKIQVRGKILLFLDFLNFSVFLNFFNQVCFSWSSGDQSSG